nr:reverse transcriptase domain-containing protein [Tanacetum cinerariifolium]
NYHQLLPIIAEKVHQEKVQQERLKVVKARLNFEKTSQHSKSGKPSRRRDLKERFGSRHARGISGSPEPRHDRSKSPRKKDSERRTVFKRLDKGVFPMLGDKGKKTKFASKKRYNKISSSRRTKTLSESEGSAGGHWKSKPKRQNSSVEDDMSQPWACEETYPFTPWIRYFDFPKTRMPSHIKTYDGSEDPEDHLKIFQAAAKTEHWAMPTWCHMFNSTFTGNKKCIKDPVKIHNIKQRDGESTEEFMRRYKLESRSRTEAKLQEGKLSEPTKAEAKAGHNHLPHKNTKRNSGFRQREVQTSSTNDNLAKQWKRPGKGSKKEETLGKEKPLAILMVQPWHMVAKQRITQTFSPESIISFLPLGEEDGTEGPMIIEAEMGGHFIACMWSGAPLQKSCMNIASTRLPRGDEEHLTSVWMNFMVVRSPSPYNRIIGRPGVRRIQAVQSTAYGMLKFPVAGGMVTLQSKEGRKELCGLLRRNLDLLAWKPADKIVVSRHIAEHRLNIREGCLPVIQKKRGQAPDRNKAIYEEVEKLVDIAKAETAFKQMKKSISKFPMLTAPKEKEKLIIYLEATKKTISTALMTEKDGKQMPIYIVSRALQGPKINYTPMEKLILALGENKKADTLSKIMSTSFAHLSKQVLVEELKEKSIDEKEVLVVVKEEGRTWMTPIHDYLTKEILPEEKRKARAIRRKARRYDANYVLREIHEGSCSMHAGPRSMVAKALRLGFGLPGEIISDNGKQFKDNPFKDWCEKLCIRQCFASLKHPQANDLVERENRILGEGIRARLDERSKDWMEEISHVLWAHRTMIKSSNEETSFSLTYGTEVVIPVEIGMPTLRTAEADMKKNDEALEINLDL